MVKLLYFRDRKSRKSSKMLIIEWLNTCSNCRFWMLVASLGMMDILDLGVLGIELWSMPKP